MKGRLIDYSVGYNRKQRITLEIDSDFREGYEILKNQEVEINIKKWHNKRSNDANAYFHVLVNAIAEARGLSDDEVKRSLVVDYGVIAKDENGREYNCYLVYKHSSEMDTKKMSRLIEGAITVAEELNIDTDTPDKQGWWNSLKGSE